MKQYVVDELRPDDYQKLKEYLDANFAAPGFDGLYWLPLDKEVAIPIQSFHKQCQPHYFALELTPERLACELLVRTNKRVRCDCMGYATEAQINWLIRKVDTLFERLDLLI